MDTQGIETVLAAAEERVAKGEPLDGVGFRRVVRDAKRDRDLAERYGERISRIDQEAFRRWPWILIPVVPGTVLAVVALLVGLGLVAWSYLAMDAGNEILAVFVFFAGFGFLIATTHGLGHLMVGRLLGIRFTAWYVASWKRPQPGVKIEYASYLRSTPTRRAWMHAAGAVVTKIVPFALIGAARAADLPDGVTWALLALGVFMVLTDVLFSTKGADWAKVRRELRS
ncbi:MAG TPA: hypothetical protein VF246_05440 [Acidimicrobiia bacterium]